MRRFVVGRSSIASSLGRSFSRGLFTPSLRRRFVPTMVTGGLSLWLDAADPNVLFDATSGGSLVTADNGTVARFEDKSGNGRHFTQGTSGDRPALKLAGQNGRNYLLFDWAGGDNASGSKYLDSGSALASDVIPAGTNAESDNHTLFLVCSRITGAGAQSMAQRVVMTNASGNWRLANENANPANNVSFLLTSHTGVALAGTANAWQILMVRRLAGVETRSSVNGGTETTQANTNAIGGSLADALAIPAPSGSFKAHLRVGEVIIHKGPVLTAAERNAIGHYLATKWGLSWTDQA